MSTLRTFGLTADGRAVHAATLSWPEGLCVDVLDFGGIVHRIRAPAPEGLRDLILRYEDLEGYEADTAYIGALVGRVANRILGGRFPLDGREVDVSVNEPPNTLHGGKVGFNKRIWRFEPPAEDGRSLRLSYDSPDGEEGFPGTLAVEASFTLEAADTLTIDYVARASEPTPVSLTHHLYFNLGAADGATALDHTLQIEADAFTPAGPGQVPTGDVVPVAGTPFDFRRPRLIRDALDRPDRQIGLAAGGLDLNWIPEPGADPALSLSADGGWRMELRTDQPGVQVYSGQKLKAPFPRFGAVAVEPQGVPDAVNHPEFPSVILRPGETYRRRSTYRFGRA